MQVLDLVKRRATALKYIASSIILLLLTWHISFKAAAVDSAQVVVGHCVCDAQDVCDDPHDFDIAILDANSNKYCNVTCAHYFSNQSHILENDYNVSLSRAPPPTR